MIPRDLVRLRCEHTTVGVVKRVAGGVVLVRWLFGPAGEWVFKQGSVEVVGRYSGVQ